jgi:3-methyladenine DNA glycosylase/8-oxoguanine DNA glycosylase
MSQAIRTVVGMTMTAVDAEVMDAEARDAEATDAAIAVDASTPAEARTSASPLRCAYRPTTPIDLRATLSVLGRGPHDPTTIWDAAGVWRTFRTPAGAATLRLEQRRDGVDARAWGPGAAWALDGVPTLLGAGDDWGALELDRHPFLAETLRRNAGLRLARTRLVFEAMMPAILEQKVTSLEAYREWARLVRWFGEPAPRAVEGVAPDGLRVVPSAHTVRHIPSWEWHRMGIDPTRSRTLVTAARLADALDRTVDEPAAQAAARLTTLPGIGGWTAAETLQRSHGDPDQISVGDYHVAHLVGYALTGERTDDEGMLDLLHPWAGQRQRVVRLIELSGRRPERRGPRATITDHRGR